MVRKPSAGMIVEMISYHVKEISGLPGRLRFAINIPGLGQNASTL